MLFGYSRCALYAFSPTVTKQSDWQIWRKVVLSPTYTLVWLWLGMSLLCFWPFDGQGRARG